MRAALASLAISIGGVALTQPHLARVLHEEKQREDVYLFPPAAQLRALTLGHRAATADLFWAKLLVEYGIHWQEKRPFPDLERYIDAILTLEPDYQKLYLYVDTLLVYRPTHGEEIDARHAREYLERGTRERPNDYKVWQHYGEFVAFLAPGWLASDDERNAWRRDGAIAIMHSIDLGADPYSALAAASVLSKTRELRVKAADDLKRAYVMSDDPSERAEIAAQIARLDEGGARDVTQNDVAYVDARWRREGPFLSRGTYLLIGPTRDAARCAGRARAGSKGECALEWEDALPSRREP